MRFAGIEGARAAVGKTAAAEEADNKAHNKAPRIIEGKVRAAFSLLNVSLGERA